MASVSSVFLPNSTGTRASAVPGGGGELNIVRAAAGVAEIGVGEQLLERAHAVDQALLMAIKLHGLRVLAVCGRQSIAPQI
jgi:hypothetical protein